MSQFYYTGVITSQAGWTTATHCCMASSRTAVQPTQNNYKGRLSWTYH